MKQLAQGIELFDDKKGYTLPGKLGEVGADATNVFTNFLSTVIGVISIVAIIWFVFTLIMGGIGIMTAGSDKAALEGSKKKITNGLIGLVVTLFGLFIADFIGNIFGLPGILDIGEMLETLL